MAVHILIIRTLRSENEKSFWVHKHCVSTSKSNSHVRTCYDSKFQEQYQGFNIIITIKFTANMEETTLSVKCIYDFLYITDGKHTEPNGPGLETKQASDISFPHKLSHIFHKSRRFWQEHVVYTLRQISQRQLISVCVSHSRSHRREFFVIYSFSTNFLHCYSRSRLHHIP